MNRLGRLLRSRSGTMSEPLPINADPQAEREAGRAEYQASPRLAHDFSRVKLHSDPEAAATVESLGARALTWGNDIFFGPGELAPHTAAGRGLLAHEMTHVVQQRAAGEPAVQFAPKKRKPGIGAAPPAEKFLRMTKPGTEDDFVLFSKDNASMAKATGTKLLMLLEGYTEGVQVEIHGYSSDEGPEEYNVNLSAHRAVAVKHFLQKHLPVGSKVTLFAHGESRSFGVQSKNRRAGVWVGSLPAEKGTTPSMDLRRFRLGLGPLPPPSFRVPDVPIPPIGPRPVAPPSMHFRPLPRLGGKFNLDWRAMAEPGGFRGQTLGARDAAGAAEMGQAMYSNLTGLGFGPGIAEWWTNRVLQSTYEARLVFENPSFLDLSSAEMRKFYPDFSEIVVPFLTPDTMNWLIKKTFKKDIEFRF